MKKVILLTPHRHDGTNYEPGARLDMNDADAKFISDNGIGKIVTAAQAPAPGEKAPAAETKPNTNKV
jgi:hypothetical protein